MISSRKGRPVQFQGGIPRGLSGCVSVRIGLLLQQVFQHRVAEQHNENDHEYIDGQ